LCGVIQGIIADSHFGHLNYIYLLIIFLKIYLINIESPKKNNPSQPSWIGLAQGKGIAARNQRITAIIIRIVMISPPYSYIGNIINLKMLYFKIFIKSNILTTHTPSRECGL